MLNLTADLTHLPFCLHHLHQCMLQCHCVFKCMDYCHTHLLKPLRLQHDEPILNPILRIILPQLQKETLALNFFLFKISSQWALQTQLLLSWHY